MTFISKYRVQISIGSIAGIPILSKTLSRISPAVVTAAYCFLTLFSEISETAGNAARFVLRVYPKSIWITMNGNL